MGLLGVGGFLAIRLRISAAGPTEATQERHRLADERKAVERKVDLVLDPDLTPHERLTIIDGFIPRLNARAALRPYLKRFVVVSELSPSSKELLTRARRAVTSVSRSRVAGTGLLDDVANEVLLPRQVWEIARLLHVQTQLQQEQEQARRGLMTAELRAVLEPQQAALTRSVAKVTARVAALEEYAHRVATADAALKAREALANNGKYQELLAHTDDAEGMNELMARGEALESTLARSVRDAIDAGRTLAL
ncbi:hypothetical protein HII36_54975 [Nonomuraea sp. NN258]|uniref:hypothetical protein n=1 Tax=Nonomuraea antri TaxID=2730852 RepID=UPI0015692B18|nr:hypothetical protein [Nonomuraea antri]NRQ40853.1 hypothetical protein [Nonomuraea antri]